MVVIVDDGGFVMMIINIIIMVLVVMEVGAGQMVDFGGYREKEIFDL